MTAESQHQSHLLVILLIQTLHALELQYDYQMYIIYFYSNNKSMVNMFVGVCIVCLQKTRDFKLTSKYYEKLQ